jgi:peptidoglycan/xylan/chitin deacetylase (PgdA/CDA1 family)
MSFTRFLLSIVVPLFRDAIFYQPTREQIIALTIDDSPTPDDREDRSGLRILDAIARHHAKYPTHRARATFFIITGHLQPGSLLIDRLLADGHEIGNHGTRDCLVSSLSPTAFERDFKEAHEILTRLTGRAPRWYRPGRALYNGSMRSFLRGFPGYEPRFALASMMPLDTGEGTNDPGFTARYLSGFIFPGAILVLHGGSEGRDANTAIVLEILLEQLYRRGYEVVTLSELVDRSRSE